MSCILIFEKKQKKKFYFENPHPKGINQILFGLVWFELMDSHIFKRRRQVRKGLRFWQKTSESLTQGLQELDW